MPSIRWRLFSISWRMIPIECFEPFMGFIKKRIDLYPIGRCYSFSGMDSNLSPLAIWGQYWNCRLKITLYTCGIVYHSALLSFCLFDKNNCFSWFERTWTRCICVITMMMMTLMRLRSCVFMPCVFCAVCDSVFLGAGDFGTQHSRYGHSLTLTLSCFALASSSSSWSHIYILFVFFSIHLLQFILCLKKANWWTQRTCYTFSHVHSCVFYIVLFILIVLFLEKSIFF